ncbi:hypothetical protein DYBT9275_03229 [Dyadobacter sp. CECT 9275]|uniref:Peptidase S8/S53 domain-containing protein n=1 Tax=Dyadobacter helix TaxID=2822344 RepID=A0A916JE41_9BACT|nr:S8 family peptidase [Dyadobacter sp. CECT 9275]CAG5003786.1 hypothetical protein DYBT9275_03229 [Dyadobacter sp. CECT 9275]
MENKTNQIVDGQGTDAEHSILTKGKQPNRFSGFIIICLLDKYAYFDAENLIELAKKFQLGRLLSVLESFKPQGIRRTISSVATEKLRKLEEKARETEFAPLHSLSNYWRLDYRNYAGHPDELVKIFQGMPEIELAYKEMIVTDPFINASDDTFVSQQGYLNAAPTGIDARWAWTQIDRPGDGVGFIDLEQGWIPTHEDLAGASPTLIFNDNLHGVGTYVGDHGTAVLGEVVGIDNGRGIVGIAPFVDYVRMVSHYEASSGTALHVADAILAAIDNMNPGDVLLLEVQRDFLPTETDAADLDAIRLAVANGIVVVEAAGNGNENLDSWLNSAGRDILDRGSANFIDSGAIMVGASVSTVPHHRASFSNFGSRIDCYAWGENIVTSGYANRLTGSLGNDTTASRNDDYTSAFGGTSGASPIIVGAALILQGVHKADVGSVISPQQMRLLLTNPATGTAQGTGVAGNIGVMPNLRAIIENTLEVVPDVYLRDYVGDTGNVPASGAISASPDIIVRPSLVADPDGTFGEGSGNENSSTLGSRVEAGQDNYIYVRIKNKGGAAANNVRAAIYWSEVSTLVTPNLWHFIGNTSPVDVPVGDILVVSPPLTWGSASLPPANTHQCFVGILSHPQDPAPAVPGVAGFDWDDFYAFIRNNNNITWRNFDVVNDIDPSDPTAQLEFNITGSPDKARPFEIEILNRLPEGARIILEIPYKLYVFSKIRGVEAKVDRKSNRVLLYLPNLRKISLGEIQLPKEAKYACRMHIKGGKNYEKGAYQVAVRQLYEKFEVGRVTWSLKSKRKLFV